MSLIDEASKVHVHSKKAWEQVNLLMEVENAGKNYHIIHEMKEEGRLKCLSECPEGKGIPAIITGSGSSANKFMPMAKDWKGAIFCSTTHFSTYVKHGRPPDYFMSVDPRVAPNDEFGVPPDSCDSSVYVSHVSSPLEYFDKWRKRSKGMSYVYRILEPSFDWYTKLLPAMYPWSRVAMLPFIDSVATQIQLAARLGYNPIFMVGTDYGGARLDRWEWKDGEWIEDKGTESGDIVGPGGLKTYAQMDYAKRGALIAAALQILNEDRKTSIYQTSLPSNVVELPYANLDYVMEHQDGFKEPWKEGYRKHYIHQIEVVLAAANTYLIPTKGGYGTDYRIFMMIPPNFLNAILDMNREIIMNKMNFAALEKRFLQMDYAGAPLCVLDMEANPKAVQDFMASPPGQAAGARAKADGKKIEMRFLTIREQIRGGFLKPQKGEMIIHEAAELENWKWQNMHPMDVEAEVTRLAMLKRESEVGIPPIPPFAESSPPVNPLEAPPAAPPPSDGATASPSETPKP